MIRKRILVVQQNLRAGGGGQGVCAWILQALRDEHDVSVLTWNRPDIDRLNRFYGTSLAPTDFELRLAMPWLWPPPLRNPRRLRRLHLWTLAAIARRLPEYDLLFAVDEELDLGDAGRGIQYVSFPRAHYLRPEVMAKRPLWHATALRGYYRAIAFATGTRMARTRGNVTIVNSAWTGRVVHETLGIDSVTIHPPAAGTFAPVPWAERTNDFVAVGRMVRGKRHPLLVDIIERVRARGFDVGLTVVGGGGGCDQSGRMAELARTRPWLRVVTNLGRDELARLLSGARYGLHGMLSEHFGMAIAEMVVAGQLPFVPDSGGQTEIVGDDRLMWRDPDQAVEKIVHVLGNPALQAELRQRLTGGRAHFGPERFMREIRAVVDRALGASPPATVR